MSSVSLSVLRLHHFRLLLLTRAFSSMALQAQAVIVGWQVYSLTKDPFYLGLTGLAEAIPAIITALFAGHIVDTYPPARRIHSLALGCVALNTVILLLLGGGFIPTRPVFLLVALYLGIFLSGITRSFIRPASFSMIQQIVGRKRVAMATGYLTTSFQVATVGGPALAGLIYGGYGARYAWLLPAVLTVSCFVMSLMIRTTRPDDKPAEKPEAAWTSIKAGWLFIWRNQTLLSVMTLDMFAVLFGGAVAMLPAYADQILHVGAQGLGALRAAPAFGSAAMALYLSIRPMQYLSAKRMMVCVAGFGLCIIGFGLSTSFWLSLFFLGLSGMLDAVSVVIRWTMMQVLTPPKMLGRVSSVNGMFVSSSNEIGSFESGTAARVLGLVPSVVFGGVCTLLIVATTAIVAPKFRKTVINTAVEDDEST